MDLSAPGRHAPGDPAVAVSPEGRAIVAWWQRDAALAPTRDVVQIRRRASFTAPFIGPVTLSRRASNFEARTDAAAAGGGLALVAWTEDARSVALRVLPRTGPAPPATVLAEGDVVAIDPLEVGIGATGAAVAAWTRVSVPAGPVIRLAVRSAATGAWSGAGDLSGPGARHPAVAVAPDGSALVAWDRGGRIELSAIGADGVVTGAPTTLSVAGSDARLPAVAVNAAGDAVVAWYQDGAVTVSERAAGGAFGAPRAVSAPGGFPEIANLGAPSVGLAADGRAVAAWRQRLAGHFRVAAAIRPAGLGWDPPALLSPAASRNAGRPALAVDAAGHAVVAWSQPAGVSQSSIRARTLARIPSAFGALEAVSTAKGRGTAPSAGLDAKGRAVLAWREDPVGGPGRFFRAAVRFSPG